jgi:hypothetical protein
MTVAHLHLVTAPTEYEHLTRSQKRAWLKAESARIKAETLSETYQAADALQVLLAEIADEKPTTGLSDLARVTWEFLAMKLETMRGLGERKL